MDEETKTLEAEHKTLEDENIETERVGRRSAVAVIGGTLLGGLALAAAEPASEASAQSDSDGGRNADPAGRGRTGRTDSDGGPNADRAGHGRRGGRARRGRVRSGCSDSDGGQYADPGGAGRRCGRTR